MLVRSGRGSIPGLRRSLGAAGRAGGGRLRRHPAGPRAFGAAAAGRAACSGRPRLARRRPGPRAAALAAGRAGRDRGAGAGAGAPARATATSPDRRCPRASSCWPPVLDPSRLEGISLPHGRSRGGPGRASRRARACLADGGSLRGGAVDDLGRARRGRPDSGGRPSAGVPVPGWRTATSTRSAPCSTPPARAQEQSGYKGLQEFLAMLHGAGAPGRHARRDGDPQRGGAAADRPPGQGPRVAARRRRARPGGDLARPAPALDPARRRHHPPRGLAARRHDARAARRRAAAVLRRRHPRQGTPDRDRGRLT